LHQEDGDPTATTVATATAPLMRWVRRRGSPVQGNLVDLLSNGQEYFPALIEAIDAARVHVVLETYIYADDAVGARVTDALIRAAQRGVDVRLVVDGFGAGICLPRSPAGCAMEACASRFFVRCADSSWRAGICGGCIARWR
jgi:cardiolipin synthase